jgi:hypothetical protein
MHAHEPVAALPVDARLHLSPNEIRPHLAFGHVNNIACRGVFARITDSNLITVLQTQDTCVAGLPSPHGIEHRTVEMNTGLVDGRYHRFALRCVRVLAK